MKRLFAMSVAVALMGSAAYAQVEMQGQWYVVETASGEQRVMGGANTEGSPLLMGEAGAAPADCAEGSFYKMADGGIAACGEGGAMFDLTAPDANATMEGGGQWPEGAMLLSPRESGTSKRGEGGGAGGDNNNSGG